MQVGRNITNQGVDRNNDGHATFQEEQAQYYMSVDGGQQRIKRPIILP